jgi:hypothetical protein
MLMRLFPSRLRFRRKPRMSGRSRGALRSVECPAHRRRLVRSRGALEAFERFAEDLLALDRGAAPARADVAREGARGRATQCRMPPTRTEAWRIWASRSAILFTAVPL